MDLRLKEAAKSGNIDALYELFHEDPHLLNRIDEVPFIHTPLHEAAAAGQVDFAMEMMNLKPSFASKINPDGFTPLLLALQNHQTHLIFQLLKINNDLVRVKGKKGMTLLHYAAEQGNVDLLAKFLLTCPPCIQDVTVEGKTALHIAAENNQVEALQLLARWLRRTHIKDSDLWEIEVLNWKDNQGNTILHIAASSNIQNQAKMISVLLECGIRKNIINLRGLTALDVLQYCQSHDHVDNREAVNILSKGGGRNASSIPQHKALAEVLTLKVGFTERLSILINRIRLNIPSDTRNAFIVLAGLIITATYQAVFNPPGGVRQGEAGSAGAGKSVMDTTSFLLFYISNTTSFLATVFPTILFLIIGPYGTSVLFPLVPLSICYVTSALVINPTPMFTYFIWVTLGIAGVFGSCLYLSHAYYWGLIVKRVTRIWNPLPCWSFQPQS